MEFIEIGFGNAVSAAHLLCVTDPDSAPIKRLVQEAKDDGRAIDATFGRKTRAVIVMDSGHIVLSSLVTDTLAARINENGGSDEDE